MPGWFDGCKTAKMRVGAHLGPDAWDFDAQPTLKLLYIKEVTTGFSVNFQWCKILNIIFFAIRYIKLYSEIISSMRPKLTLYSVVLVVGGYWGPHQGAPGLWAGTAGCQAAPGRSKANIDHFNSFQTNILFIRIFENRNENKVVECVLFNVPIYHMIYKIQVVETL